MGAKYKEHGAEGLQGLSSNWISGLQQLMNGGGLGTAGSPNAAGATGNVMGILQDILAGGKGQAGGAISQLLSTQQERDVNGIRSRFGVGGGTAFGTPGAYAESNYRAQAAPQITQALTGLQLQALAPLLAQFGQFTDKATTGRVGQMEKSGLGQAIGTVAQIGGAALPFLAPGIGSVAKAGLSAGANFAAPATFGNSQGGTYGIGGGGLSSLQGYFQ